MKAEPMRIAPVAIGVLTAATVVVGIVTYSRWTDANSYIKYADQLRDTTALNDELDKQLVLVHGGSVPYFDGLDTLVYRLTVALDGLKTLPGFLDAGAKEEILGSLGGLADPDDPDAAIPIKIERVERFKSEYGRLRAIQNYFTTVAGDLTEALRVKPKPYHKAWEDGELSQDVDQILREMQTLELVYDAHIADRIDAELHELRDAQDRPDLAPLRPDMTSVDIQGTYLIEAMPRFEGLTQFLLSDQRIPDELGGISQVFEKAYERSRAKDAFWAGTFVALLIADILAIATAVILTVLRQREAIRKEHDRAETLLLNILPAAIADQLKQHPNDIIAEDYADVTVLFADIVGFTPFASKMKPVELVGFLNRLFSAFDRLAAKHGLEKIKTLGDAYMVAGGLPDRRADHAEAVANMAMDMQQEILSFRGEAGEEFGMRIGMNSGPVVAGVIGIRKFIYDLWGDAVNVASRMESQGVANAIHCSASTRARLEGKGYFFEDRGVINVKGKGEMKTFLLVGRDATRPRTTRG